MTAWPADAAARSGSGASAARSRTSSCRTPSPGRSRSGERAAGPAAAPTRGRSWRSDRCDPAARPAGPRPPPGPAVDPPTLGYTRRRISSVHSPYALSPRVRSQRCPLSSASSRIADGRPVPHIVTELPGPKARAHVEFDETWTSPSLPRAYPIVPVRGDGLTVEDIDGNLFLDFAAGIAVNSTGPLASAGRGRDQGAGRRAHPLQRERLLPADLPRGLQRNWPGSRRSRDASAPTSATRAPRSSRPRSSWPATPPIGRTSSPSWARSTGGPTAPSR